MTNFRTALIKEKPLYIDGTMKVNFTVDELVNFVEDYLKDNQPILTVEVHGPVNTCKGCGVEIPNGVEYCSLLGCAKGFRNMFGIKDEPVKHTQDNHLHTKF
jgi:hypothetical protein